VWFHFWKSLSMKSLRCSRLNSSRSAGQEVRRHWWPSLRRENCVPTDLLRDSFFGSVPDQPVRKKEGAVPNGSTCLLTTVLDHLKKRLTKKRSQRFPAGFFFYRNTSDLVALGNGAKKIKEAGFCHGLVC
jgi:hypothetical protein